MAAVVIDVWWCSVGKLVSCVVGFDAPLLCLSYRPLLVFMRIMFPFPPNVLQTPSHS
jgi:hypothetical protein